MEVDYSDYSIEDFKILGFKKALVEDNEDPLDAGRVRIRILGIHSMDPLETPISHLPWAEPAVSISHSGGYNSKDIKFSSSSDGRYVPSVLENVPSTPMPDKQTTKLLTIQEWQDKDLLNCGTGGKFEVPAKGSTVWIFFDDGCHLYPKYIAMAVDARDWKSQKEKVSNEIFDKSASLEKLLSVVEIDNSKHLGSGDIDNKISIETPIEIPNINIGETFFKENYQNLNSKISSWTSPGGTTFISVHENETEKLYVMHKGYLEYTDENGQRTTIVGTTNKVISDPINPSHSNGRKNDEKNVVAGNKNLYILGDFSIFVKNNCFIQCEKSANINVNENVGVVTRNGNINILSENSDINLSAPKSNINFSAKNIQLSAEENIICKSKESFDIYSKNISKKAVEKIIMESNVLNLVSLNESIFSSNGRTSVISDGYISMRSSSNISMTSSFTSLKSSKSINFSAPNYIINTGNYSLKSDKSNIDSDILIKSSLFSLSSNNTSIHSKKSDITCDSNFNIGGSLTNILGNVTLGIGTAASPSSPVIQNPESVSEPSKTDNYKDRPYIETKESIKVSNNPSEIE